MNRIVYFIFFFHAFSVSLAQELQPSCKHFTTDDGLPSSETYRVLQDRKGFIWIATDKGVSRYDGYSFQNFSVKEGLPDNTVLNLFEDEIGRLWFIPISLRLSYWDGERIIPYKFNSTVEKEMKMDLPVTFYSDVNDNIYISGKSQGAIQIDSKGKCIHFHNSTAPACKLDILQIQPDRYYSRFLNANIYKPGDLIVDIKTESINGEVEIKDFDILKTIFRIKKLKDNRLLFGTGNTVHVIDSTLTDNKITFSGKFTSFYEDNEGESWVGTSQGLFRYPLGLSNKKNTKYFDNEFITSVTGDNEKGYWIATLRNGVFYLSSKEIISLSKEDGLSNEHISQMQVLPDKSLLFSDMNGNLKVIKNSKLDNFKFPFERSKEYYYSFYFDEQENILWQSWANHTSVFIKGLIRKYDHLGDISQFYKARDGKLYCAASMRLFIVDKLKPIFDSYSTVIDFRVSSIFQNYKGEILIANHIGLWKFNKKMDFEKYDSSNPNLNARITSIAEDSYHRLFLGTRGKGIMILNLDSTVFINTGCGITSDNVQQLLFDKNNLYAATNQGISKIIFSDLQNLKYEIKQISVNDGLVGNEINQMVLNEGQLWIATNKGISVFNPDKLLPDSFQSPVYIQSINIADADTTVRTDTFNLSPDQNRIKINYTGIIMKAGGKVEYRYRLLGLDSSWNYTNAREANFNSLPPGYYRFQLQVQNKSGEWSTKSASAFFFIAAPLWKRGWFIVSFSALVLITTYVLYRRRLSRIEKAEAAKTELNRKIANLELKALRAQMNPHFTFNVMNSIQHFIANNDMDSALRYMSKFAKLIRTILAQSEFSLVKLSEKLQSLQLYVELEQLRFEEKFDFNFDIDETINPETTRVPTMIVQPFVENAIKHGIMHKEGKGKLSISLARKNGSIIWTVEDNGVGRQKASDINKKKNKQHNSIGMKNTAERIETLNALYGFSLKQVVIDLYDESGQASGTRVIVTLPFLSN